MAAVETVDLADGRRVGAGGWRRDVFRISAGATCVSSVRASRGVECTSRFRRSRCAFVPLVAVSGRRRTTSSRPSCSPRWRPRSC
jgi:hypothetical protein